MKELDLVRLGIYLAKKEKFDWHELSDQVVRTAVCAAMDEKNTLPLQLLLRNMGVNWENGSMVEAIEKQMKDGWATRKMRDLLHKKFGLKFSFNAQTTIDNIRPMLSDAVLKELGIEPNEETND